MKTINFMLHPGMGKTATTWLQSCFAHLPRTFFIGKDPWYKKDLLYSLHYSLFPSYFQGKFRARNSYNYIAEYAKQISDLLKTEVDNIDNIILSDECIMGYGIYNAELNIVLSKILFDFLSKELYNDNIKLKPTLLYTIREQKSALQSIYAYDYIHQREKSTNFEGFLEWGKNNSDEDLFGGLNYFETSEILGHIIDWPINFVPYEILNISGQEKYLLACCNNLDIKKTQLKSIANTQQPLNVNHNNSATANYLRKPNIVKKLYYVINNKSIYRSIFRLLPNNFRQNILSKKRTKITNQTITFPNNMINIYQKIYHNSNMKLSKKYNLHLDEFGY